MDKLGRKISVHLSLIFCLVNLDNNMAGKCLANIGNFQLATGGISMASKSLISDCLFSAWHLRQKHGWKVSGQHLFDFCLATGDISMAGWLVVEILFSVLFFLAVAIASPERWGVFVLLRRGAPRTAASKSRRHLFPIVPQGRPYSLSHFPDDMLGGMRIQK